MFIAGIVELSRQLIQMVFTDDFTLPIRTIRVLLEKGSFESGNDQIELIGSSKKVAVFVVGES